MRGQLTSTFEDVASPTHSDSQPGALIMRTGSVHGSVLGATNAMLSIESGTGHAAPPSRSRSRGQLYTPPPAFDPVESGAFTAGRERGGMPPLAPRGRSHSMDGRDAQRSVFVAASPARPPFHRSSIPLERRSVGGFLQEASRSITRLSLGSQAMGRIVSRETSSAFSDLPE